MNELPSMIRLAVTGQDVLAKTVAEACSKHFEVVPFVPREPHERIDPIDLLWICYDTPIGPNSTPDTEWVLSRILYDLDGVTKGTLVIVSSQIPVGSTAMLEREFPHLTIAHSPENLRVKTAMQDFQNQARVVVGIRNPAKQPIIEELLAPFTREIQFVSPETAEMVKHALNCYLGMSIAYINEIARLCEQVGADPQAVSRGLLTDFRVSPKAPLRPGPAFGGGHLARDIITVSRIAAEKGVSMPIVTSILESNSQ